MHFTPCTCTHSNNLFHLLTHLTMFHMAHNTCSHALGYTKVQLMVCCLLIVTAETIMTYTTIIRFLFATCIPVVLRQHVTCVTACIRKKCNVTCVNMYSYICYLLTTVTINDVVWESQLTGCYYVM